nr:transcription initiation factor TFIID subunit 3-like isoform X2 [Lytechinus pictus]
MAEGFCQALLRVSMAQICQELGWHSIHSTPCDLLTDVLQRYIQQLASVSHCYAEQYGRTEPNVDDLGLTFNDMGVSLYELENYIRDVDPIPFKHDIPQFPLRRKNDLQHPKPGSRDDRERLQYIPAHLPPIIGLSDDFGAPIGHHRDSISSVPGTPMDTDNPDSRLISPMGGSHTSPRGEKRETASPLFSDQAMKRLRLDGDGTPQELTAVSIGIGGELTPKREGKLPIATTPPQRVLKAALAGDGTPMRANKAITDGLLNRSEETIVDRLQQKTPKVVKKNTSEPKSPKSAKPVVTPKQKAQTKSPIHMMFSPSSKYPMVKSKTSGTPGAGDKAGEFQFPPPKSPKVSVNKKQQEKLQESAKKEKTVPSVYDFDDDEFDSTPSKDPTLSPSDAKGFIKDPLSLDADLEQSKNQSSDSSKGKDLKKSKQERDRSLSPLNDNVLKSKKVDKDKKKLGSKDKSKIKQKPKNKKGKDDVPSYYDSVGSMDKKHTTPKAVKRKNSSSDGKTPKLVINMGGKNSGDDEMRVIKKKFKKVKEKDKQKQLKVKKLKQKSIDIKMKSKASKQGITPSSSKPQEDSSPEKRVPIGKLSLIRGTGSKLKFKIAVPPPEKEDVDNEKARKAEKPKTTSKEKPKVKRLKTSSSDVESSDKDKKTSKEKKKTPVSKDKKKESVKKDKEEAMSTPTVPKITFKLGSTPAGGDALKFVIKTSSEPPSSPSTPTVPKLSIAVPSKKSKDSSKSSKSVSSPKTEPKSKGESKTKAESKPKAETKKAKNEPKPKTETKSSKTSKKKEKDIEREMERENEKEKKEKEKKVKEKPIKLKVDTKPKAEVSPYDFDAPSPTPSIKAKKESSTPARKEPSTPARKEPSTPARKEPSTPARKEPVPGIFAPSVPSPPPSKSSSPATPRTSTKAAAPSSPAPSKSKQKASTPAPTPPPTKAALKALPPSATKASKAAKQKEKDKEKEKASQKQKAAPPPLPEPEPEPPKPQADGPCILIAETAGTVVNEDGEKIWYCPACKKADDGVLPMVGCDSCDDWYHWECVGLTEEPCESQWFCKRCQNKSKGRKKKGRKN